MYFTARHAHPWVVEFSSRLQRQVFDHIIKILTCTSSFGVFINVTHFAKGQTVKERIVHVTNKQKLCQLFTVDRNGEPNFRKN